jgi:ParB family transcriptional regulator, chromosome partitioning protein
MWSNIFMATAAVRRPIEKTKTAEALPHQVLSFQNIPVDSVKVGKRMRPLGDIDSLVASINEIGLLNPITVNRDMRLISGLHRLNAFKSLGKPTIPALVLAVSKEEAQLREIDENLARNELSVLERAEHYARRKEIHERLFPETRNGGNHGNQHTGGIKRQTRNVAFCQNTESVTGQSSSTVRRLIRIAKLLSPETKALLRGTSWADNQRTLTKLCKLPTGIQESVAGKAASGESNEICDAISKVHRDRVTARRCSMPLIGHNYRLLHGDFRKVGDEVASNSIDLILTDAPYEKEYLNLFKPLSLFASRVLCENGSLVIMMGQSYLPQVLVDLSTHLRYHWTICTLLGARRLLVKPRRVIVGYKPMLWFTKGSYRGHSIQDVVRSEGPDKGYHPHGQSDSEFAEMIRRLTGEDATILDPFVGGGNVADAAIQLGRKFVGIDVDKKHIATTRRRIAEMSKRTETV